MDRQGAPVQLIADRLSELYPDDGSMRRVLALAGVDARRVLMGGQAINAWWSAVVEAQRQDRLRALVEIGLEEYPLDEWLGAAHRLLISPALAERRGSGESASRPSERTQA